MIGASPEALPGVEAALRAGVRLRDGGVAGRPSGRARPGGQEPWGAGGGGGRCSGRARPGVPVWSELELAYALLPNPFDAITGTNGKTTTTALLGHLFETAGRPVRVLGNIGVAVTSVAGRARARRGAGGGGVQLPAGGHAPVPAGRRGLPQPHARPSGPARHHGALPGVQGQPVRQPAAPGTWPCSTWPTRRWPAWAPSWRLARTGPRVAFFSTPVEPAGGRGGTGVGRGRDPRLLGRGRAGWSSTGSRSLPVSDIRLPGPAQPGELPGRGHGGGRPGRRQGGCGRGSADLPGSAAPAGAGRNGRRGDVCQRQQSDQRGGDPDGLERLPGKHTSHPGRARQGLRLPARGARLRAGLQGRLSHRGGHAAHRGGVRRGARRRARWTACPRWSLRAIWSARSRRRPGRRCRATWCCWRRPAPASTSTRTSKSGEHFKSSGAAAPEGEQIVTATTVRRRPRRPRPAERAAPRREAAPARRRRDAAPAGSRTGCPLPFHLVWVITVVLLIIGPLHDALGVDGGHERRQVRLPEESGHHGGGGRVCCWWCCPASTTGGSGAGPWSSWRSWCSRCLLVHVPGVARSEGGAASWIPLGPLTFQPSEFAKLAVVLLGAHLLTSPRVADGRFRSYMCAVRRCAACAMCALVVLERDLGTAIIIAGLHAGHALDGGHEGRAAGADRAESGCGGAVGPDPLQRRADEPGPLLPRTRRAIPQGSSYQLIAVAGGAGPGRLVRGGPGAERAEVPVPAQGPHRHDLRHPGRGVRPGGRGSGHPPLRACSPWPAGGWPGAAAIPWGST